VAKTKTQAESRELRKGLEKAGVDIPKEAKKIFKDLKDGKINEREFDKRFEKLDGGR